MTSRAGRRWSNGMQPHRAPGIFNRERLCHVLLALAVVSPTLLIRWTLVERTPGPHLDPRPDALEYAAAAQALALEGRYCLHVGPETVRPRYAPGWPMLLSVAIRCGMETESLWRLTGLFGAAHAYVLAVITVHGVRLLVRARMPDLAPQKVNRRAFLAGACAGWGWAITPVSIEWDRTLMSDEPTAFFGTLSLAACALALVGEPSARRARAAMLAAGVAAGMALATRPIAGCLLVAPIAVLFACGAKRHGAERAARRLAVGLAGLILVAGLTMFTMHRSGYRAWEWSGYRFWIPKLYDRLGDSFSLRNAFEGHPDFALRRRQSDERIGNLAVAGNAFLGLRGLRPDGNQGLGRYWPMTGWLCAAWVLVASRRAKGWTRATFGAVGLAVAIWIGGHIVVYSLYFFPAVRFYIAPLAWCWVATAIACAAGIGSSRRLNIVLGYVAISSVLLALYSLRPMLTLTSLGPDPDHAETRRALSAWLNKSAAQRAVGHTPFDPVEAQALGLLTPEALDRIGTAWGTLPNTEHVWRLKALGRLANDPK
ncbi:MAG: hypothetical protein DCC65_15490 [Planctomycetota bacterium]|nr:MAG: hypothetical protein DCC65_15490 [Planctomycetota bacterium]